MRASDFYYWTILAAFYLLMVHLFPEAVAQGPPGIKVGGPSVPGGSSGFAPDSQHDDASSDLNFKPPQSPDSGPKVDPSAGTSGAAPFRYSWDQFGIDDAAVRQNLVNLYGTMLGQPDCIKKSMCVLGNTFHDLPGRDAIFTFLSRYVPEDWSMLYDIFRVSIMYGQNCKIYVCDAANLPEPTLENLIRPIQTSFMQNLFNGFNTGSGSSSSGKLIVTSTTPRPAAIVPQDNEVHKEADLQNVL